MQTKEKKRVEYVKSNKLLYGKDSNVSNPYRSSCRDLGN